MAAVSLSTSYCMVVICRGELVYLNELRSVPNARVTEEPPMDCLLWVQIVQHWVSVLETHQMSKQERQNLKSNT